MAEKISRRILCTIEVGGHGARQITYGDLDSLSCSSLRTSSQIIAEPCDISWECRIKSTGSNEDTCIYESWYDAACDTHDKTDGHNAEAYQDKRIPLADFVAIVCDDNSKDGCGDVDGYGQELSCRRAISECANDRGQEERYAV